MKMNEKLMIEIDNYIKEHVEEVLRLDKLIADGIGSEGFDYIYIYQREELLQEIGFSIVNDLKNSPI